MDKPKHILFGNFDDFNNMLIFLTFKKNSIKDNNIRKGRKEEKLCMYSPLSEMMSFGKLQ